jgi:hypothetical protein
VDVSDYPLLLQAIGLEKSIEIALNCSIEFRFLDYTYGVI